LSAPGISKNPIPRPKYLACAGQVCQRCHSREGLSLYCFPGTAASKYCGPNHQVSFPACPSHSSPCIAHAFTLPSRFPPFPLSHFLHFFTFLLRCAITNQHPTLPIIDHDPGTDTRQNAPLIPSGPHQRKMFLQPTIPHPSLAVSRKYTRSHRALSR
jgi:hypothetical protein